MTLERRRWVSITVLHAITNVSLEEVIHLKKLLANLVHCTLLISFILLPHLFEAVIRAEFDLLSVVNSLFLTYRSVKVDVLLLESTLSAEDLIHK